jgi:hypothetical protein
MNKILFAISFLILSCSQQPKEIEHVKADSASIVKVADTTSPATFETDDSTRPLKFIKMSGYISSVILDGKYPVLERREDNGEITVYGDTLAAIRVLWKKMEERAQAVSHETIKFSRYEERYLRQIDELKDRAYELRREIRELKKAKGNRDIDAR